MRKLISKQRKDMMRVMTYGTGVGLLFEVPAEVKKKEEEIKELLGCKCDKFGCYAAGHTTTRSKKCKYHTFGCLEEIEEAMEKFLHKKYPLYYGAFKSFFECFSIRDICLFFECLFLPII